MRWERSRSSLLSMASMTSNKTTFIATTNARSGTPRPLTRPRTSAMK